MNIPSSRDLLKSLIAITCFGILLFLIQNGIRWISPPVPRFEFPSRQSLASVQPTKAATVDEFAEPWSYKEVMLDRVPGIIIRLPDEVALSKNRGIPYVVVSRLCPYDGCVLKFKAPTLLCPCDEAVFFLFDGAPLRELPFKLEAGDIFITGAES